MRKPFRVGALVMLGLSLLAGCASGTGGTTTAGQTTAQTTGQTAATDRLDAVKSKGVLRVGTETTYPPMEFTDDTGKPTGFDIDMMQYIAERMGVTLQVITTDFAGITEGLSADRFDTIAATMNVTEDRKKRVLFSEPYIAAVGLSIIVTPGSDIKDFAGLSGKKLGIQQGSTTEDWTTTRSDLGEIKKYLKVADALMDLSAGRVDAVVTDNVVGAYYMKQNAANYVMLEELMEAGPVAIAIPMNSPKLKAEVDKILAEMKTNGKMAELSQKWFGMNIFE